jgi:hypothetical protein
MASSTPFPIRFTEEDQEVLADLQQRTGLTTPGVVRLALRTLRDHLAATTPKRASGTGPAVKGRR